MQDAVTYRELGPDEMILPGDQWLLCGCRDTWMYVGPSIGRIVKEQMSSEGNYAEKFRRPVAN